MRFVKGIAARVVLALAAGITLGGCTAESNAPHLPIKPVLYVFTQEATCAPCRRLKADWNAGRLLALNCCWKVTFVEYNAADTWQQQFDIESLPTFATANHVHQASGYDGPQNLLRVLGVR